MLNNEDVNEQLVRCVPLFFNCDSEMQCHIRSMADSNCGEGSDVPEGKVEKVCREWLVREDGVLAYKLQKEEIQHHYGHNKQKNKLARSDLQEARTVQRSEEEEAAIIRQAYEQMLQEQEDADAMIAQQLQEKIMKEDIEKQKHMEEEDQRIAMELQRKEKLRLQKKREEKELRQVEKARAEQSTINGSSDSLCRPLKEITLENGDPSVVQECDLSDLCMDPPSNLTEEEMKNFREQQDSELARFLQEHEMKRRSQNCQDRQMAIEAQDRELARVLQEQERAKAKRARERAKQKALLQQQQESMSTIEEAQVHYSRNPDHEDGFACHKDDRLLNSEWLPEDQSDSASGYSSHQIKNVAMVIDPTYNQKKPAAEFSTYSQVSESYSPASVSPGNCDRESPPYSPVRTSDGFYVDVDDNDLESAVPPYMPIQGQRRPMSLEKGKKCKKHRDGCKTQ